LQRSLLNFGFDLLVAAHYLAALFKWGCRMKSITSFLFIIFTGLILVSACNETSENISSEEYYNLGMEAYRAGDHQKFLEYTEKANSLDPGNYNIEYNLACGYALAGRADESVVFLEKLIEKGVGLNFDADSDFNSIRETDVYKSALLKVEKAKEPIHNSELAYVIPEKDLIPEGIAYDPVGDAFYLGSIYKSKILKIERDGTVTEFKSQGEDGLVSMIGMKVENEGKYLWACSCYGYQKDNIPKEKLGTAMLYKFDLSNGEVAGKWELPQSENHFMNDVVLNSDNDAFMTDSHVPGVYMVNHVKEKIEKFIDLEGFNYPNGIALSDNENLIYIATGNEIAVVDIRDKSISTLTHPENIITGNCDGLYFYKNSLIGIQGFMSRIAKFNLNEEGTEVVGVEVLESFNPDFEIPTTGAIAGDEFYYIANAQLGKFDSNGKIFPMEKLTEVKIMRVKL